MLDKEKASKLKEWFDYAEQYRSRDLIIHNKVTTPNFSIGYKQNRDSKKALPTNQALGDIIIFDYMPSSEFSQYLSITETANGEKLERNKVVMGQNVFDESITSALDGRGVRVGGVNQNDYLITLTFHLIPSDAEYLNTFLERPMVAGGVEEALIKYWDEKYGLMTEEELDYKISELLAQNDKIVTRAGIKAKMHEMRSQNF